MTFWIREFENGKTGQRFRVHSETQYLPPLRRQVAEQQGDSEWLDDMIYKHDPSLDIKRDGNCQLGVEPVK